MIKISILVLLTIISFQLYAKVTNDILVTSNKNQQEKLERGVSELGAERERVRAISREIHHNTKTGYKINNPDYKATRIISNKERLEKLERGVSELGAKRERARAISQEIHHNAKTGHKINNPDYKATRIISNKERLEKLERGVSELGAERERTRAISQEIHHNAKTGHKINNSNYKATRIISNKERLEKLERGVSELGAERKRVRAQIQDRK